MRKATVQVYSFDELSDDVKKKVLEAYREYNVEFGDWYQPIYEGFTEKLEQLGYSEIKPYFSGFWSQGDGACFEGKVSLLGWLKSHKLKTKYKNLSKYLEESGDDYLSIKQVGHYYHSKSMAVVDEVHTETDKQSSDLGAVIELIENEIEEVADELYRDLEKYYEELTSDEAVTEAVVANDQEFEIDGKPWYSEEAK